MHSKSTNVSPELAGIILAGGASTRMGSDKRLLRLAGTNGRMLLEHMLNLLTPHVNEQIVVLNDPDAWPDLPARLVPDLVMHAGPLGGLVAGLSAMQAERAIIVACDMPFICAALLDHLAALPADYDAIVPLRNRDLRQTAAEPLLACYQRRCLPIAQACLEQGERRMTALLDRLNVHYLHPSEWQQYDPTGRSFLNLNRPEDLAGMPDGDAANH